MKSVCLFLAVLCLLMVTPGCDDTTSSALIPPKLRMTIEASHLTPLQNGYNYKAWAKVGDTYLGTELFNVTSTGQFTTSIGQFRDKSFVLEDDATDAEIVLISIEGKIGNAERPSGTVVLAGDVSGVSSTLTTAHPSALGSWLVSQSGKLTIMTPSDTDLTNESHGVWFLTVSGSTQPPAFRCPLFLLAGNTKDGLKLVVQCSLQADLLRIQEMTAMRTPFQMCHCFLGKTFL